MKREHFFKALIMLLFLVALIPPLFGLNINYFYEDDVFIEYAKQDFNYLSEPWIGIYFRPLSRFMLNSSYFIFGESPYMLTVLISMFFALSSVSIFFLGEKLYGKTSGLFAYILFLLSTQIIALSIFRNHSLYFIGLFFLFSSFYYFIRFSKEKKLSQIILFFLLFIIGVYSINITILLIPFIVLHQILSKYKVKAKTFVFVIILLIILSAPVIIKEIRVSENIYTNVLESKYNNIIDRIFGEIVNFPKEKLQNISYNFSLQIKYVGFGLFILALYGFYSKMLKNKRKEIAFLILLVLLCIFYFIKAIPINELILFLLIFILIIIRLRMAWMWLLFYFVVMFIMPITSSIRQQLFFQTISIIFVVSIGLTELFRYLKLSKIKKIVLLFIVLILLFTAYEKIVLYDELVCWYDYQKENSFENLESLNHELVTINIYNPNIIRHHQKTAKDNIINATSYWLNETENCKKNYLLY